MRYFIHFVVALSVCFSMSFAAAQDKVVVLPMGGKKALGDATPVDVAEGKTFSNSSATGLIGIRTPGVPGATGQTLCYDPDCVLFPCFTFNCSGSGQDGELLRGAAVAPRFVDNGNGTVTDKLTGLIWLQDSNCIDFFLNDPLTMNQRTWQQALESANLLSGSYCGLTDGSIAGDWRLPNIRELQSLIDYSQFNPSLPIDHPFGAVSGEFWSSTTNTLNTHHAWVVNFTNFGIFFGIAKSDNYQVRAVRDGL